MTLPVIMFPEDLGLSFLPELRDHEMVERMAVIEVGYDINQKMGQNKDLARCLRQSLELSVRWQTEDKEPLIGCKLLHHLDAPEDERCGYFYVCISTLSRLLYDIFLIC